MLLWAVLTAWAAALAAADFNPAGKSTCPCIEWADLSQFVVSGQLQYTPPGSDTSYTYPANYGNLPCEAHDSGLAPHCASAAPPAWCAQRWCYVDKQNCDGLQVFKSVKFPRSDVYYSYATCAESNAFSIWYASLQANGTSSSQVTELLDVVVDYLWSTRATLEGDYAGLLASSSTKPSACSYINFCPCVECYQNALWGEKTDFAAVGAWLRPESGEQDVLACLVEMVASTYGQVAAKEAQPTQRVGYQYFSDQKSGSYIGWPALDWCPTNYDPRFRPWYSSGSTGPKDVLIVVDVSGSMGTANRYQLAKQATEAVLDTLDWKDYTSVILFNQGISAQYSSTMVPVTDLERGNIKTWLNSQSWQSGGTDFKNALDAAFNVIRASITAGTTSMCQKAIIFLTDGEAPYSETDFQNTANLALSNNVVMFTYALGSGADTTVTKRLACDNRGIFYPVPDGADLARIMSSYYEYFATGQDICLPSFTKYTDVVTSKTLWPACLPAYDRTGDSAALLGVTCMDINVIVDPATMESEDYWEHFKCKISDTTKMCRQLDTSSCRLEKLRQAVGASSVCLTETVPTTCPCVDPACEDDLAFIDEKGYFCDTWVGDDCSQAQAAWGFSAAGQQNLMSKCPRSCGLCSMLEPCPTSGCQSNERLSGTSCRACRTDKVTGLDITGIPMLCPGSTTPVLPSVGASSCAVPVLSSFVVLLTAGLTHLS